MQAIEEVVDTSQGICKRPVVIGQVVQVCQPQAIVIARVSPARLHFLFLSFPAMVTALPAEANGSRLFCRQARIYLATGEAFAQRSAEIAKDVVPGCFSKAAVYSVLKYLHTGFSQLQSIPARSLKRVIVGLVLVGWVQGFAQRGIPQKDADHLGGRGSMEPVTQDLEQELELGNEGQFAVVNISGGRRQHHAEPFEHGVVGYSPACQNVEQRLRLPGLPREDIWTRQRLE